MNKRKLARIISDIFIPITFSAFMSFYIPFVSTKTQSDFWRLFLLLFLSTVLIPLIYFIYKRKRGEIINRDAEIKEERNDVYQFTILVFSVAYVVAVLIQSPIFVQIYLLNFTISTIGVFFINRKIKISIHTISAAGTSAFLLFLDPIFSIITLLITILIMWSRVTLKVHTLKEVFYGLIYGICVTLIITILVLSYAT
ncbi:MAG: hypothetical protein N3F03_01995 [Ignavibacteria bacterium]|nr:hypothetical protein [Ignavibacteria bacterium]